MKGRLESELYHGEAQFAKLAPRDVSRSLPGKVLNLVVYAKPSILKFSGHSVLEESVEAESIQPLIIRSIPVMAKRRDWSVTTWFDYWLPKTPSLYNLTSANFRERIYWSPWAVWNPQLPDIEFVFRGRLLLGDCFKVDLLCDLSPTYKGGLEHLL